MSRKVRGILDLLVDAQWGDVGKGKFAVYLAKLYDWIVRFNGGNNAGHTAVRDEKDYHLHFIPSPIVIPGKKTAIGAGEILEPWAFLNEVLYLLNKGVDTTGRIFIDPRTNLILFYHRILDIAEEMVSKKTTGGDIGTTAKGIGPCNKDLVDRRDAITLADLLDEDVFVLKLKRQMEKKLKYLFHFLELSLDDLEYIFQELDEKEKASFKELKSSNGLPEHSDYLQYFDPVKGFNQEIILGNYLAAAQTIREQFKITDVSYLLNEALDRGENVLAEAAQGSFLDVSYGTRPYVTSSHPIAGGACIGIPIGPTRVNQTIMLIKAFTTRVGGGPFPTEDEVFANLIRGNPDDIDGEYGTTTGRERRCGKTCGVTARTAAMWNHPQKIGVTKLDFLDPFEKIEVAEAWEIDGTPVKFAPHREKDWQKAKPIYKPFKGWKTSTRQCRKPEDLPEEAIHFLDFLKDCVAEAPGCEDVELMAVGVGPDDEEMVVF